MRIMADSGSHDPGHSSRSWWQRRKARIAALSQGLSVGDGPYFVGRNPLILLLILALIGTFATGFLTYRHVVLESHTGAVGESALCRAEGQINCDAILLTEYSILFGYFPSAVLGLMGFVFVLWLLVNSLLNDRVRKIAWAALVLYFVAAIGFSWYFAYIMAFEVDFVCTWCIVVHIVNLFSLIIVVVVAVRHRKRFLLPEVATVAERSLVIIGAVLASCVVFLAAGLWEKALSFAEARRQFEDLANDPLVMIATLVGSPDYDVPVGPGDPAYGSPSARHNLVFFSDFQCPACAQTEKFLRKLVDRNPKILRIVFKNYPLSKECNSSVVSNLHPLACRAASAAYTAFLMAGPPGFWKYADLLFEHQKELSKQPWAKIAADLGLDQTKFQELMKPGSVVQRKISEDVDLGNKLRLDSTPQVFFEKKRIPRIWKEGGFITGIEELIRRKYPEEKDIELKRP